MYRARLEHINNEIKDACKRLDIPRDELLIALMFEHMNGDKTITEAVDDLLKYLKKDE